MLRTLPTLFLLLSLFGSSLVCSAETQFSDDVLQMSQLIDQSDYLKVLEQGPLLLEKLRKTQPDGSLDEAKVLDFMVNACYRSRQVMNPEALVWGKKAVQLKEELLGPDSPELANSLMHMGNLFSRRWEIEPSITHFDRAISILEKAGAEHDAKRAINLASLGVAYRRGGNNRKAMELYEQAQQIQEDTLGPNHPDLASTLNNRGVVYTEWGDYSASEKMHRRAMEIREKHFGPDHEWVAESGNNLANQLAYLGLYKESLAIQERTVEIFAQTLGTDHRRYWVGRLNMGITYSDMGDYAEAMVILTDVVEGMEKRFGTSNPLICYAQDALGNCFHSIGKNEEALDYFSQSLAIAEAAFGVGSYETADTMNQRANTLAALGRLDEAVEQLELSLEIFRADLEKDNGVICSPLNRLAEAQLQNQNFEQALENATLSSDLARRDLGSRHPLLATSTLLMGQALKGLGQPAPALDAALLAEDVSRGHLNQTMSILSEHRALHYAATRVDGLNLAISLLEDGQSDSDVTRVWDAVIRSRSGVLDQFVARNLNLSRNLDRQGVALLDSTLVLRERLANLTLRGPGWEDVEVYQKLLGETQNDLMATERKLSLRSSNMGHNPNRKEVGFEEVRAALPDDAALVAYFRETGDQDNVSYCAFLLLGKDEDPRFFKLARVDELDEAVEAWRDQATFGVKSVRPVSEGSPDDIHLRGFVKVPQNKAHQQDAYFQVGDRLRHLVWDPIHKELGSARSVFLVTDGSLHLVSFPSLPLSADRFLLEEPTLLHHLTTEKTLAAKALDRKTSQRLLVVGGAKYENDTLAEHSPETDFPSLVFSELPQAEIEARRIQGIWDGLGKNSGLLMGEEATEAEVISRMSQADVIHLATHGFFMAGEKDRHDADRWDNPLSRAGLALTGANHWHQAEFGSSDGILTAQEVAALDLSKVRWAVLSACDTGLGELAARGEGVMGLRRAFALAGAQTVIMSLWSVDDESTRLWMESLYLAHWENHASTAEAVRQASLEILTQRRAAGLSTHPFYWAGFMAAGHWQ